MGIGGTDGKKRVERRNRENLTEEKKAGSKESKGRRAGQAVVRLAP
jgi:hypothetical protein